MSETALERQRSFPSSSLIQVPMSGGKNKNSSK